MPAKYFFYRCGDSRKNVDEKTISCCFFLEYSAPEAASVILLPSSYERQIDAVPTSTKFLELIFTSSFPEICRPSKIRGDPEVHQQIG